MSGERGFTLLEMLVTLGILALCAGIGFPAVQRALAGTAFRTASARVEIAVRERRAAALRGGRETWLSAEEVARIARGDGRYPVQSLASQGGFRFYPDGSASGGDVTLSAARRSHRFSVDRETGAVRVSQ